jgi:hypothetical protein
LEGATGQGSSEKEEGEIEDIFNELSMGMVLE